MHVESVDSLAMYDKILGTSRIPFGVGRLCMIYLVVGDSGLRRVQRCITVFDEMSPCAVFRKMTIFVFFSSS